MRTPAIVLAIEGGVVATGSALRTGRAVSATGQFSPPAHHWRHTARVNPVHAVAHPRATPADCGWKGFLATCRCRRPREDGGSAAPAWCSTLLPAPYFALPSRQASSSDRATGCFAGPFG